MSLPRRARGLVVLAVAAGAVTIAWAVREAAGGPALGGHQAAVALLFGLAMVAAWVWPLRIFRDGQAEALHVDEGFFVLLALLLPSWAVVCVFASATLAAQAVRHRHVLKSAFNTGQVVASAGIGLMVLHRFAASPGPIGPRDVGAATLAALAYMTVNTGAFVAIVAAMGSRARRALLDGLGVRLLLVAGGVVTGLTAALAVQGHAWAGPLAVAPFVLLPRVLSGHFKAHHDRLRLRGLFETTLDANRSSPADIRRLLTDAARRHLSCSAAEFSSRPGPRGLSAPLVFAGRTEWLVVSPEGRTAPFDDDDRALLNALAAVGATALSNASLYEQSQGQKESLAAITSNLGEGVCALDLEGRITFVNPAAAELLGWPPDVATVPPEAAGSLPEAPEFLVGPAFRALETRGRVISFDSPFRRADGSVLDVSYSAAPITGAEGSKGAVIAFRDISVRKRFEEQLTHYAFHDPLTGLANRRLFLEQLTRALERSNRSRERHAVLFADVDRFKLVNDSLGHQAGDELLKVIGSQMQTVVRGGDLLARFGGDEFTLLLEGVADERDAVRAAGRIAERLSRPVVLQSGHEVLASVSIGIALSAPGDNHDDLLRNADVAMYAAKERGRIGACEVFDSGEMGMRSSERIEMEADLRHAVERGEIEVHFQPVLCSVTGEIRGAEALVRWRHPTRGLLSPARFIPLAEESGLIINLGHHVLEESCRWARRWAEQLGLPLLISVNLSGRQFGNARLESELAGILNETGVDARQLCLEITETVAVDDLVRTDAVLGRLRGLGVKVAIDDFGTGYSSLAYLNRFPIDVVKIDQSFVRRLGTDRVSSAIVSAVISLSGAIGATTVAEGVETVEQLATLTDLHCPRVQGYLLARPLPAEEFEVLLLARRSLSDPLGPQPQPAR